MLTRIRNAVQVRHESVSVPASRMKSSLLKLMQEEGFISGVSEKSDQLPPVLDVEAADFWQRGFHVIERQVRKLESL